MHRAVAAGFLAAAAACGGSGASGPVGTPCQGLGLFTLLLERATLEVGQETRGNVIARGCGGTAVSLSSMSWESTRPDIAAFGPSNEIVAVAVGSAQIIAKLQGEFATATVNIVEPTPPAPPPPGGMALQLFSPSLGAVVDDSVRVLASVSPQGMPLARVSGTIGPREFALHAIYVGMSRQELWEARVRMNDLAAGNYKVIVRAFNTAGVSAADSVIFERRLLNPGGTGTGPTGNKLLAPAPKRP